MNYISQRIAIDPNTTLRQRLRLLVLLVFGHEALLPKSRIKKAYCPVLKEKVYKPLKLKRQDLAVRKLVNPFKLIEFLVRLLFEMPIWFVTASVNHFKDDFDLDEEKPLSNTLKETMKSLYIGLCTSLVHPLMLLTHCSILAILSLVLAPAREIIRPMISMAKTEPYALMGIISTGLALGVLIAVLCMVGIVAAASVIGIPIAVISTIALMKTVLFVQESHAAYRAIKTKNFDEANLEKKDPHKVKKLTTAHMTEWLHGLNGKLSPIVTADEQDFGHSMALFVGVEALAYETPPVPKSMPAITFTPRNSIQFNLTPRGTLVMYPPPKPGLRNSGLIRMNRV